MIVFITIFIFAWLAGIIAFFVGVLASLEKFKEGVLKDELIHSVIAFGGGVLVAVVAFTLAPEGIKYLDTPTLFILFCTGVFFFCLLDNFITKTSYNKSQFMAMIMYFLRFIFNDRQINIYKLLLKDISRNPL